MSVQESVKKCDPPAISQSSSQEAFWGKGIKILPKDLQKWVKTSAPSMLIHSCVPLVIRREENPQLILVLLKSHHKMGFLLLIL